MKPDRLAVVVPTYWGPVRGYELGKPSPAYDHPTPSAGEGTLPRLLDSLAGIPAPEFRVILVVGATREEIAPAAERRVKDISRPYQGTFPVEVVGAAALGGLKERVRKPPFPISLSGYGNIRNVGLLAGLLSGADVLVLLDDDEVVEPDHLARAVDCLRRAEALAGGPVGVGGPYLDAAGEPFLAQGPPCGNPFLDKAHHLNAALERLLAAGGPVPTPVAFGGNMVLGRALARKVPFDPLIPRGEDIDYVLSSWLLGYKFYFDRELTVTHLPPREPRPSPCEALRRDVVRFLYQREKLAVAHSLGLSLPIGLGPYPGRFLQEDLELQAAQALQRVCGWEGKRVQGFLREVKGWALHHGGDYFWHLRASKGDGCPSWFPPAP